ncbi:hypothetical protein [Thioalkalivibrio sp. XN279]|uniref:hypothetical protein n=1 Tax=Thioalkalivibrio sp. XN279 TaxID=2714953 RepID=UPI00140E4543|nr:hypothetical protein [Thioalkalivibrio sp. XN279]NHA13924.1 hypothetical protein [Thioalkalivibrio sp. XN279]
MTTTVCRQCNADTMPLRLGRLEGEEHGVHIVIEGLPALDCSNGHKRFPTPEFPLEFIQRMLGDEGLITAEPAVEKGLFRKRRLCPDCGTELSGEPNGKSTHQATVDVPDSEAVSVELSLPVQNCSCGREVTLPKSEVERGVMQAAANAFRSAEIPPG